MISFNFLLVYIRPLPSIKSANIPLSLDLLGVGWNSPRKPELDIGLVLGGAKCIEYSLFLEGL